MRMAMENQSFLFVLTRILAQRTGNCDHRKLSRKRNQCIPGMRTTYVYVREHSLFA